MRGTIPHHRDAVAMAKVALEHAKDPEMRKLAKEIIQSQDVDIAQMEAFREEEGYPVGTPDQRPAPKFVSVRSIYF